MGNRYDENPLWFDAVEQREEESGNHGTPDTTPNTAPACRELHEPSGGLLNEIDEVYAEIFRFRLEVSRGSNKFRLSFRVELDAPHRIEERALRNTSSAGTPATFPERSSSRRRSASSSQRHSLSGSE